MLMTSNLTLNRPSHHSQLPLISPMISCLFCHLSPSCTSSWQSWTRWSRHHWEISALPGRTWRPPAFLLPPWTSV